MSSSDSDDDTNEQYLEQAAGNGKIFDEIILTVARTTVYYHNNFVVKEPCRYFSHTGRNFIMEVLNGNDQCYRECFGWKSMYFVNYVID